MWANWNYCLIQFNSDFLGAADLIIQIYSVIEKNAGWKVQALGGDQNSGIPFLVFPLPWGML